MRPFIACSFAALSLLWSAAAGTAGSINVSPTRLSLAKSGSATNLTLRNEDTAAIRFSVRAFRWAQQADGSQTLDATDDLIVFPQIVTIGPQSSREIRIAYTGAQAPSERAFRILVTELATDDANARGLQIRTRLSIPLFLVPPTSTHAEAFENATATKRGVAFDFAELGSAHAFVLGLHATGKDAGGATLFDTKLTGWYLLPGQPRHYDVAASGSCPRLTTLTIEAQLENEPSVRATLVPIRTC